MSDTIPPAVQRYIRGEISALRAAAEIGDHVSVSDVIMMVKVAGLPLPRQDPKREAIELERARRILGLAE